MFRRHVGDGAAERGRVRGVALGGERGVEVGEERPAESVQEHVGRFDVAVQDAVVVGMGQRLGHARPEPAHRLHEVAAGQVLALAQGRRVQRHRAGVDGVEHVHDRAPAPRPPVP